MLTVLSCALVPRARPSRRGVPGELERLERKVLAWRRWSGGARPGCDDAHAVLRHREDGGPAGRAGEYRALRWPEYLEAHVAPVEAAHEGHHPAAAVLARVRAQAWPPALPFEVARAASAWRRWGERVEAILKG